MILPISVVIFCFCIWIFFILLNYPLILKIKTTQKTKKKPTRQKTVCVLPPPEMDSSVDYNTKDAFTCIVAHLLTSVNKTWHCFNSQNDVDRCSTTRECERTMLRSRLSPGWFKKVFASFSTIFVCSFSTLQKNPFRLKMLLSQLVQHCELLGMEKQR